MRDTHDRPVLRIDATDFRASACEVRLEFSIEMVRIGTLRLELPRHPRTRQSARTQDRAVLRPDWNVRAATRVLGGDVVAVRPDGGD
jgi:hypothetical protein